MPGIPRLFADLQHGYQKKKFSTKTALHAMSDAALQAIDEGEISLLVFLDL